MRINPNKTVCANSKGIIVSFRDANKHRFLPYENQYVQQIQLKGSVKHPQLEKPVFNKTQQKLYAEMVYGLGHYSAEDLKEMSPSKKFKILARYAKAQRVLNRWKQEIVHETVDSFLISLFPNSPITKALVQTKGYDRELRETHSFKELGMDQQRIAGKLIEAGLLPTNFFQLA